MSKKKSYRDLKNEIIDLKNALDAKDGRIAVLLLANAALEDKKTFNIPLRTETKVEKSTTVMVDDPEAFEAMLTKAAHFHKPIDSLCDSCSKDDCAYYCVGCTATTCVSYVKKS